MGGGFDAFEVLASGAFDHLNCQHTKSQMPGSLPEGVGWGEGGKGSFGIDLYIMRCSCIFQRCLQAVTKD